MTVLHADNERRGARLDRDRPASPRHESRHWLSINEACRLLGVDQSTLRRWSDAGKVPLFRTPGGHRRYAEDDLLALLGEKGRRPATYLAPPPGSQPLALEPADGPVTRRTVSPTSHGALSQRPNEVLRHIADLLGSIRATNLESPSMPHTAAMIRQAGGTLGSASATARHGAHEMVAALVALRPRLPLGTPADHLAIAALRQVEAASQLLDQALVTAVQAHADTTLAGLGAPLAAVSDMSTVLGDA